MAGRILVLDDEENYAEMLHDLLRENNYRVDMATQSNSKYLWVIDIFKMQLIFTSWTKTFILTGHKNVEMVHFYLKARVYLKL